MCSLKKDVVIAFRVDSDAVASLRDLGFASPSLAARHIVERFLDGPGDDAFGSPVAPTGPNPPPHPSGARVGGGQ